jgi:SEC-C motif-containing protein
MTNFCVCGSGKLFEKCCSPLLSGTRWAKTPEQLMRSRYSAYVLGGYGDYLLKTWFPATAKGLTAVTLSLRTCDWVKLEILDKSQKGDQGTVEFNAWFHNDQGDKQVLHEKSVFQRINGRWLYVGGEVGSTPG